MVHSFLLCHTKSTVKSQLIFIKKITRRGEREEKEERGEAYLIKESLARRAQNDSGSAVRVVGTRTAFREGIT